MRGSSPRPARWRQRCAGRARRRRARVGARRGGAARAGAGDRGRRRGIRRAGPDRERRAGAVRRAARAGQQRRPARARPVADQTDADLSGDGRRQPARADPAHPASAAPPARQRPRRGDQHRIARRQVPTAGSVVYSATKFGLRGFSMALADELRGTGVTVSSALPAAGAPCLLVEDVSCHKVWSHTGADPHAASRGRAATQLPRAETGSRAVLRGRGAARKDHRAAAVRRNAGRGLMAKDESKKEYHCRR